MEATPWKKSVKGVESTPSSSSSSSSIAYLPNPILMEILSRVSIKTLSTSKSVCKSWLDLIKDPHFIQMHQRRSPTEVCFQPYHGNGLELHLGNFHFPNNLDPCHFQIPNFSVKPNNVPNYMASQRKLNLANTCNGLLCYYNDAPYYRFAVVWNPCTGEFITFPPSTTQYCLGCALGFSGKENKFKLLRLMRPSSPPDVNVADICTIEKSCSWKTLGPCSPCACFHDPNLSEVRDLHAVYLQGTLHWVDTDGHWFFKAIHTFDFEDDRFGSVPLPHYLSTACWDNVDNLGVLEGCLFLVVQDGNGKGLTLWLMKEYGVQDSWTKLFCLGSPFEKGLKGWDHCLPIIYMDNGEILMKCTFRETESSTVIVFNPVLKSARVMASCPTSLRVIAYRPNLVMLKDSMLGYDVHAIPRCPEAGLERREMSRALDWWKQVTTDDEENLDRLIAYEKAKAERYARAAGWDDRKEELWERDEMDRELEQLNYEQRQKIANDEGTSH